MHGFVAQGFSKVREDLKVGATFVSNARMIILYNPKATKFRSRRFPLSILSIAAVLEGREEYAIVDGNIEPNATETLLALIREKRVELLAVTVMPGPQTVSAVESCREIRERYPEIPIVWGGYFPSNYTQAALNAPYVDFAVRGQGEDTFLELLASASGTKRPEGHPRTLLQGSGWDAPP